MIEIVLSYLNRARKRINAIVETGTADMYGTGELGNVYYGRSNSTDIPTVIDFDKTILSNNPSLPLTRPAQYKNLYVDEGVTLNSLSDWGTILVSDTLYLRGTISVSNVHNGAYAHTTIKPDNVSKLLIYGETNYLITEPFFITGGTGNPFFGNSQYGGGFVGAYYNKLNVLSSDEDVIGAQIPTLTTSTDGSVNINGGTSGNSGGCLLIAARNIAIAETGQIKCCGGEGNSTNTSISGLLCQYHMTGRSGL